MSEDVMKTDGEPGSEASGDKTPAPAPIAPNAEQSRGPIPPARETLTRTGGPAPEAETSPAPAEQQTPAAADPNATPDTEPERAPAWVPTVVGVSRAEDGTYPAAPIGMIALARMAGVFQSGVPVLKDGRYRVALFPQGFDVYHADPFTAAAATRAKEGQRASYRQIPNAGPTRLRNDAGKE